MPSNPTLRIIRIRIIGFMDIITAAYVIAVMIDAIKSDTDESTVENEFSFLFSFSLRRASTAIVVSY